MFDQDVFLNQILDDLHHGRLILSTLPEVALRVNDVVENPKAGIAELSDVIITDAALSAQLVKVANSILYRGRFPVDSVQVAVSRLGMNIVKNIVSSLLMKQMFRAPSAQLEERLGTLWRYNVDVAAISHVLAHKLGGVPQNEAMLAGLIHNIGALPIILAAQDWPELMADELALDLLIAKKSTQLGVAILEKWDFPGNLIEVVAEYKNYQRDNGGSPDLVDVVQVATLQSHHNSYHTLTDSEIALVPAFRKLNIQTEMQVVELEENSAEYAEILALFGHN